MWVTAQELIKVSGMPTTTQGVAKKARLEGWEKRTAKGVRGGAYEYSILSLSDYHRALVLKAKNKIMLGNQIFDKPKPAEKRYCAEALWSKYEKANDKQKEEAQKRVLIIAAVRQLIGTGCKIVEALETIAQTHNEPKGNIKRWYYETKKIASSDLLPALLSGNATRDFSSRYGDISPEAWDFFVADYFRPEQPAFNTCYQRLCDAAKSHGWVIPHKSSIRRRVKREITHEQKVLWR